MTNFSDLHSVRMQPTLASVGDTAPPADLLSDQWGNQELLEAQGRTLISRLTAHAALATEDPLNAICPAELTAIARIVSTPAANRPSYAIQRRNDGKGAASWRPEFILDLGESARADVEHLFNAPYGMRGHYYSSPERGDAFTRDLINSLMPHLEKVRTRVLESDASIIKKIGMNERYDEHTIASQTQRRASLEAGKVWFVEGRASVEPATLNARWRMRGTPEAIRSREGFCEAIKTILATDEPATTDPQEARRRLEEYLAGIQGADQDKAGLGTADSALEPIDEHMALLDKDGKPKAKDWKVQNHGAQSISDSAIFIAGAFVDESNRISPPPHRKRFRSQSIHWFGFS